jgi:hypothetical protein
MSIKCRFGFHDWQFQLAPGRVYLRCGVCLKQSPGWGPGVPGWGTGIKKPEVRFRRPIRSKFRLKPTAQKVERIA